MSKLILFNMITVDGYFEGEKRDISWHNIDVDFNTFAIKQLESAGMLLFGHVTYDLMASYWPTEQGTKDDSEVAHFMNTLPKVVFSRTMQSAEWENTTLMHDINVAEIQRLKKESEKDLFIFGSSDIAVEMAEKGLLDEVRVIVNPLVLGKGKLLFSGIKEKLPLKLTSSQTFSNGNVLNIYDVVK